MIPNLDKILREDLKPEVRFDGVGTTELTVDLLGQHLRKLRFSVDEVSILDVEVQVGKGDCDEAGEK